MKLLGVDNNAKTVKGVALGYSTAILYLAPSDVSGVVNVCPFASVGCKASCLNTAGRGIYSRIQDARIAKTKALHADRKAFIADVVKDIKAFLRKCEREGLTPSIRLNGTSDLPWHKWGIMEQFPEVQFYDYTKNPHIALEFANGKLPANYHVTFSRSESNHAECVKIAKAGGNVAVVFSKPEFPAEYLGLPVVNGDKSDLRFLDGKGVIVGLKAKGKAKSDSSGFVVPV